MQYKDEFDDSLDFKSAVSAIFGTLNRKDKVAPRRPVWAVSVVLALVLFLVSVLWYSYPREVAQREAVAVPIIRADAGAYKVVPRDPGGMEIAHRDSTVFDTLRAGEDGDNASRRIERLLPDAEEPVSRDQIFAGLKTEIKVEGRPVGHDEDADDVNDVKEGDMPVGARVAESGGKPPFSAKTRPEQKIATAMPVPRDKPAQKNIVDIAEEVSRTEPAAGVETFEGRYFVQLGSLSSHDAAETSWKDLQKSLSVLRPLNHRIQKADLGARGIYYRVQAGPMDEAQARRVCASVEAQRPGGCLVARD